MGEREMLLVSGGTGVVGKGGMLFEFQERRG